MSNTRPIIFVNDDVSSFMKQFLDGNMENTKIKNEVIDLEKMYVVTKRYAGNVYFARPKCGYYKRGQYLCDSTYANGAKLFDSIQKAQEVCDKLNELKGKHKELDNWKQREIERIEKDWESRKESSQKDIEQQQKYIDDLNKVDYDSIVKSVETKQDKKYKVLYGGLE